jgi:hypothetical protein
MAARSIGRAFIIMPFGRKPAADGTTIDFDAIYAELLGPAAEAAGLAPHRADSEQRGGSIHADMFQDLLLSEFVVADLTIDNPNVWYEIGVRHALRASGAVLTYAMRDRLPFDLAGQRMQRYTLAGGVPDPTRLTEERRQLAEAIGATLGAWRGRKASPVYAMMPNLREPDWKSLKVGDVNEFWEELEAWQGRVALARQRQRPGDIVTLAEESPNRLLDFEALRTAAEALIGLNRPRYALMVLERARLIHPEDWRCRQLEGIALGRDGRFDEARELLRRLAAERRDGETLALLARSVKDQWRQLWRTHPQHATDPVAAARDTAATLAQAADAYLAAFRAQPGDSYPGINTLICWHAWQRVTGRKSRADLPLVTAGVRWAVDCALTGENRVWALITRAELALIEGERDAMLDDYTEAAALAVAERHSFVLDSCAQTLRLFEAVDFQPALVKEALAVIASAERQLRDLSGQSQQPAEPARVVLFSGHMVDRPDRAMPRFPESKARAAAERIVGELDRIGAAPGDLGIAQAAAGGDLLFAGACLARGMRLEIYLPQREPAFLDASVAFAAPHWQQEYDALRENPATTFRIMPDELGPTPEGIDVYDRCNRWMLHSALSCGLAKVSFLTLWDGKRGDGPGGAEHMAVLARRLTGRQPATIDPSSL